MSHRGLFNTNQRLSPSPITLSPSSLTSVTSPRLHPLRLCRFAIFQYKLTFFRRYSYDAARLSPHSHMPLYKGLRQADTMLPPFAAGPPQRSLRTALMPSSKLAGAGPCRPPAACNPLRVLAPPPGLVLTRQTCRQDIQNAGRRGWRGGHKSHHKLPAIQVERAAGSGVNVSGQEMTHSVAKHVEVLVLPLLLLLHILLQMSLELLGRHPPELNHSRR